MCITASGTATLHVAYYRKPMIVMYDAGRIGPLNARTLLYWPHRLLGRFVLVHAASLSRYSRRAQMSRGPLRAG